ncbi:hypothetical protein [Opitutus terrae]|uniref:Uncharacterized protein n=1 Tax=Opitutus terrae (strain DSM 11246 / JCM 15787 / PB90-1) TaxID=452637 RepID=B1ZYV5_OPITP|nr:hypothetical protein [Opitutus terrae]ACB76278.1 hypothetical protein Oter_2997 [Opitutus terrae PB90-1]
MHSAKNYLLVALVLTTAGGAALAWRQHLELVKLRAAALDPKERADWQQRLWAAEKRRTELEQQLAASSSAPAARDEAAEPAASADEPPGVPSVRGGARGAGFNRFAAVMDQPQVQQLMALQHKAALDSRYAGLFKRLGLSPAQLDQFKNLLVEKNTAMMDVMMAAREQGLNPRRDRAAVDQLVAEANTDIDSNIRAVLGETGFTDYKNYEQTLPQRATVNQLEQRLSYSTTPLTAEQSEQLVQILAANQTTTSTSRASGLAGAVGAAGAAAQVFGSRGGTVTETAITQSLGVLAAPQVEALRQLQQEQQAQADLAAAFRNQRQGGSTGRVPATPTTGNAATPPPPPAPPTGG